MHNTFHFVEGLLVQPMKVRICRLCGSEFELDEAEQWKSHSCSICVEIEKRERQITREWELSQGYLED